MTATRPLMRMGVAELEELFKEQSQNPVVLAELDEELTQRRGTRALALQARIRKAQKHLGAESSGTKLDLSSETPISPEPPDGSETINPPNLVASTPVKVPLRSETEPVPQLALEDACRILKVGMGDPWERIEDARRRIVLRSSPFATNRLEASQAQKLIAEAKMANDAAIVIAARRCGRQ